MRIPAPAGVGHSMHVDCWIHGWQTGMLYVCSYSQRRLASTWFRRTFLRILHIVDCSSNSTAMAKVVVGKIHKNQHERAIVFWNWLAGRSTVCEPGSAAFVMVSHSCKQGAVFVKHPSHPRFPCWKFLLCCVACFAGSLTGHHLWENYWQQYSEVSLLKAGA